ncbi:hypothetical protein P3T76_004383 [Phytophthora citrophthora]|uniref:Uncharacterized protein n=1 Tax=Phytophthora citrophthora TaxID=4793 RepID=A0AAD9GTY1_9STRA|nr:hypothetical protein P3T76_004383 [Phytophthora citrophthora]
MLDLYRANGNTTSKWHEATTECTREPGAFNDHAEAVTDCYAIQTIFTLGYFMFNLPEEFEEGVVYVLAVITIPPAPKLTVSSSDVVT